MISPMTRALQTAGAIIPQNSQKKAVVSIEPALTETSSAPSGFDVRSKQDLEIVKGKLPWWHRFGIDILNFLFGFLDIGYGKKTSLRQEAIKNIQKYNDGPSIVEEHGEVKQNLDLDEKAKSEIIRTHINDTQQGDLWLVGHGKNFKALLKNPPFHGKDEEFLFGETRSVYKVTGDPTSEFFTPPYALEIDHKTGNITGRYTGPKEDIAITPPKVDQVLPVSPEAIITLKQSYSIMREQGLIKAVAEIESTQNTVAASASVVHLSPVVEDEPHDEAETALPTQGLYSP
jgi:hypothetical protein